MGVILSVAWGKSTIAAQKLRVFPDGAEKLTCLPPTIYATARRARQGRRWI